jgi:hypothetical protein
MSRHFISALLILMPFLIVARVERTLDFKTRRGRRGADHSTTARRLVSGRPRQFCVMWQNSQCSIWFHFDVPGG